MDTAAADIWYHNVAAALFDEIPQSISDRFICSVISNKITISVKLFNKQKDSCITPTIIVVIECNQNGIEIAGEFDDFGSRSRFSYEDHDAFIKFNDRLLEIVDETFDKFVSSRLYLKFTR